MKKITILLLFFVATLLHSQTDFKNNTGAGFVENKGQLYNQHSQPNNKVAFLLNAPGMNIQLRKSGFSYDFYRTEQHEKKVNTAAFSLKQQDTVEYTYTTKLHRVDFDFEGANPSVKIIGQDKLASHTNYYNMPWKSDGVEMVSSYNKVIYKNIYTGVDLVFTVPEDQAKPVEYNFVVHENGNINDIKFRIKGAKNRLEDNAIKCSVRFGDFEETIPLSWAESGAGKETLAINYRQVAKNVYGFTSDASLKGKEIIIDPVPVRLWGTYYGGYTRASSASIANDALDNVYISGATGSAEFVATSGTFQSTYISGATPGYIAKFSPAGVQLWGTYYGTSADKIAIDSDFNVIIYGNRLNEPVNITTSGSYQPVKDYLNDCYLVKFNSQGQRLWGTYYGGNGDDTAGNVVVDSNNNIYFDGETGSTNHIATPGSFKATIGGIFNGNLEGFLVKFSPGGTRIWGTYFGGNNADGLFGLDISDDDKLYLSGITHSAGMATSGTFRPDWDGTPEILAAEFDTSGNRIWSTYVGGNANDYAFGSALKDNILYVFGRTNSITGIGTPGSFNPDFITITGQSEIPYLLAFNVSSQSIVWGTYSKVQVYGLAVNQTGQIFYSGNSTNETDITTPEGYMPENSFPNKSYLIKLGLSGERIWGTYYGGGNTFQICVVSVDNVGNICMHGRTNSFTDIATTGAFQPTISESNQWASYLVKFGDCSTSGSLSSNSPVCVGQPINLTAQGGVNYLWTGPDGFTSTLQNPVIPSATALKAGTYSCAITGTVGCDATQTIEIVVGDTELPVPTVTDLPQLTADCNLTVAQIPTATDGCDGLINATTTNPLVYNVAGNYTIVWTYTDSSGNIATQQQQVVINQPTVAVEPDVTLYDCFGSPFNLTLAQPSITVAPGATFTFYETLTDAQQQINAIVSPALFTPTISGQVFVVVALPGGCKVPSIITLYYNALPTIPAYTLEKCFGSAGQAFNLTEALAGIDPNNELTVSFYGSAADLANNIPVTNTNAFTTTTPTYTLYVKAQNSAGCVGTGTIELKAGYATEFDLPEYLECEISSPVTFNLVAQQADILAVLPAGNYQFAYYSAYADAIDGTANNTLGSVVNVATGSTTVYYRVTSSGSCPYIVKQLLTVIPKPNFDLQTAYETCKGEMLNLSLPAGYSGYKWSDGTIGQTAIFTNAGTYSATITTFVNGISCEATQNFTINVYDAPYVSNIVTTNFEGDNNSITVLPFSDDNLYSIGGAYQQDNIFTGLEAGLYTVNVKDKGGCGITTKNVAVLDYPKFFSPNADGQGDYWRIKFAATARILVTIYDRYGKLITTLKPTDKGWDGTFNGNPVPATDYWFVITQQDGMEYKGHFSLIR